MSTSQEVFDQLYALKQAEMAFQEARTARHRESNERTCVEQEYGLSGERDNNCGNCYICLEGKAVRAIEKAEPFNQVSAQVNTLCGFLAAAIDFIHKVGEDMGTSHNGLSRGRCTDKSCQCKGNHYYGLYPILDMRSVNLTRALVIHGH